MKTLADKIREERRKQKLTPEQLFYLTHLSKSFLGQIERDKAKP